ncbi:ankyrin repeat-containing protein NPR4-like [Olea europaea var. sylvestris]|uniref:ankyrin repeat-containing protein NPR4-like n=1 Tax=Olea europaea var. sylvestris TaxID=158386 RepID=UPI000C1D5463|nr:ankyrin repeat-containing protein NPR4-like [Olea europaea var. sylvestris]
MVVSTLIATVVFAAIFTVPGGNVSGPAFQMQRELQWFQEVEKIVNDKWKWQMNSQGKTPRELFTETHKDLREKSEQWMKDTSNSCMVVSTLIATVVFAAIFTVPGGNTTDNGVMMLLSKYSVSMVLNERIPIHLWPQHDTNPDASVV